MSALHWIAVLLILLGSISSLGAAIEFWANVFYDYREQGWSPTWNRWDGLAAVFRMNRLTGFRLQMVGLALLLAGIALLWVLR